MRPLLSSVRSFGELNRLPSYLSASVFTVPSFSVMLMRRPPPMFAPSQAIEPTLRVELQPVRPPARVAKRGRLAGLRVELHDAVADVGEVNAPVRPFGRPLGELPFRPELFELRALRDRPLELPVLVEQPRGDDLIRGRILLGRRRLDDGPVAEPRVQQRVGPLQVGFLERVAGVEDDVAHVTVRADSGRSEPERVSSGRIRPIDDEFLLRPGDRQLRQHLRR